MHATRCGDLIKLFLGRNIFSIKTIQGKELPDQGGGYEQKDPAKSIVHDT